MKASQKAKELQGLVNHINAIKDRGYEPYKLYEFKEELINQIKLLNVDAKREMAVEEVDQFLPRLRNEILNIHEDMKLGETHEIKITFHKR